jgi:exodeoxyribonuclease VII large subunit
MGRSPGIHGTMTAKRRAPPVSGADPADPLTPNIAEYSVSEISFALKRTLEDTFGHVRVRGELTGFRGPHSSGHCYFGLKDEGARIDAVVWRSQFRRITAVLQDGLEVVATGKLSAFPGASKYQLIVESIEPAGIGALMALVEERKRMLAAEGLFDAARKQAIPWLPRVIGVVTSPTGAVIRDILHRLADRFPRHVLVWPVRVQGETCGAEAAAAIAGFNGLDPAGAIPRPDLLIVARGGGSLEDLWGFNDEAVVRAAAASAIPLISAVGHETDWTLIDYAADERCPTPTAAAECAVPVRAELLMQVADLGLRQARAQGRSLEERRGRLKAAARGLPRPEDVLGLARQRLDAVGGRLGRALVANTTAHRQAYDRLAGRVSDRPLRQHILRQREALERHGGQARRSVRRLLLDKRQGLESCWKLMTSLSHRSVLQRGFALVRDDAGKPLRAAAATRPGQGVEVEFHDGKVGAVIGPGEAPARRKPGRQGGSGGSGGPGGQGSLF